MIAVLQLLVCLGIPAAVLLVPVLLRSRERMALLRLVKLAAEAGQPLSVEAIKALPGHTPPPPPQRDFRRGVFLVAIGLAFVVLGVSAYYLLPPFYGRDILGVVVGAVGVIPVCVGAALLVLSARQSSLLED